MSVIDDALLGSGASLHVEGCATIQALVEYDANTPPVAATVIASALYDFWCHILTCAHDTTSHLPSIVAVAPVEQAFAVSVLFRLCSGDIATATILVSAPSFARLSF